MKGNACQIDKIVEAEIVSLCVTCTRHGNCLKEFAAERIGEGMDDGAYQVQLLDECEDYSNAGTGVTEHGNLRPHLFQAGVRDLCFSCPSSRDNQCRKRSELDRLAHVSMRDGTYIHLSVVTCKPSGGLHQISEPRR